MQIPEPDWNKEADPNISADIPEQSDPSIPMDDPSNRLDGEELLIQQSSKLLSGKPIPWDEDPLANQVHGVPKGWSNEGWVWRLRYLARVCIHPDLSRKYTAQADAIEKRMKQA